jgi:hypothetical protein
VPGEKRNVSAEQYQTLLDRLVAARGCGT